MQEQHAVITRFTCAPGAVSAGMEATLINIITLINQQN
jgi:hypothetical protein